MEFPPLLVLREERGFFGGVWKIAENAQTKLGKYTRKFWFPEKKTISSECLVIFFHLILSGAIFGPLLVLREEEKEKLVCWRLENL